MWKHTGLKMTLRTKRGNIPRYLPKRTEMHAHTNRSQQRYSQSPKSGSNPKSPSTEGWRKQMWSIPPHSAMLLGQVKKWSFDPCYNIDELWKRGAELKKADTKATCALWFCFYEVSRIGKSIETESGLPVAQRWGFWGKWRVAANTGFFSRWWKCSKIYSGDGYTTLWIY